MPCTNCDPACPARTYLTKPIGVRRLLETVDEFMGDESELSRLELDR
jgi:hypothetical protein